MIYHPINTKKETYSKETYSFFFYNCVEFYTIVH